MNSVFAARWQTMSNKSKKKSRRSRDFDFKKERNLTAAKKQSTIDDIWSQKDSIVVNNPVYEEEKTMPTTDEKVDASGDIPQTQTEFNKYISGKIDILVRGQEQAQKELSQIESLVKSGEFQDERIREQEVQTKKLTAENVILQDRVILLETQMTFMHKKLVQQEDYSRRSNIKISGVPEKRGERCEEIVQEIFDHMGCTDIALERCHRIGRKFDNQTRNIIARFAYPPDKGIIMRNRRYLPHGVFINDDYSQETTRRRNTLRPIFKEAKRKDQDTHMIGDRILFKKKIYTLENIHTIPIDIKEIAVKEDQQTIAFASRFNELSNLYPVEMTVDGITYKSNEHFYQAQKCMEASNVEVAARVTLSAEPEDAMSIGQQIKPSDDWYQVKGKALMKKGVKAKFGSIPSLGKKLLATKDKMIIEATRGSRWGVNIPFTSDDLLDRRKWCGSNLMGAILMEVRGELLREQNANNSVATAMDGVSTGTNDG